MFHHTDRDESAHGEWTSTRQSLLLIGLSLINYLLFVGVNLVLTQSLTAADFGDYSVAIAAVSTLSTLATFGLEKLALKVLPEYEENKAWGQSRRFLNYSRFRIVLFAVLLLVVLATVSWLHLREYRSAGIVAVAFLPIVVLFLFDIEVATAYGSQVAVIVVYRVALPVAIIALNLLVVWSPWAPTTMTAVLCYGGAWCIALVAAALILRRCIPREVRTAEAAAPEPGWLRAGTGLMAYSLLMTLQIQAGPVILEALDVAEATVAHYVIALQVGTFVVLLATSTNRYYLPRVSILIVHRDLAGLRALAWRRLRLFLVLAGSFVAGVFVFGREILALFGPDYVAAYPATCIIAVGASFTTLFSVAPYFVQFLEKDRSALLPTGVATAVSLVLYAWLGSAYGAVGAALAYTIPLCILFALMRALAQFYGKKQLRAENGDREH